MKLYKHLLSLGILATLHPSATWAQPAHSIPAEGPLIHAHWHQNSPFNDLCPLTSDGKHAAAGCGAVAVGQVLQFYQAPAQGFGSITYGGNTIDLSTFTIDWTALRDNYEKGTYSPAEAEAAAQLMQLVGLAMDMQYDTSSSPRNRGTMMWGLQHMLHLSPASRYIHRRNYSTQEWLDIIDHQLAEGHPVVYRGTYHGKDNESAGHIFVIDGKNKEGLYHVNFGHARATEDKYVDLDFINQSTGDDICPGGGSVCYNHEQAMIINCFPASGLSDDAYEPHPMVVEQTFWLEADPTVTSLSTSTGLWADINFRLADYSRTGGVAYIGIGAFSNGQLQFTLTTNRESFEFKSGQAITFPTKIKVPVGTPSGSYDLAIIYRHNPSDNWRTAWDDATNHMTMTVDGKNVTYEAPTNYANAELTLESDIKDMGTEGDYHIFELDINNPSPANYEDTLMLRIDGIDKTITHKHTTSVYEGRSMRYRLYVEASQLASFDQYTCSAFYYSARKKQFLPLNTNDESGISHSTVQSDTIVAVYDTQGRLYLCCRRSQINTLLQQHGTFLIKSITGTEKIIL